MSLQEIIDECNKTEGWFGDSQMEFLYPYIKNLKKGSLLVELGTYHGKSTKFFRLSNPHIEIITIDLCRRNNKVDVPSHIDDDVLLLGNIRQIIGDSSKLGEDFVGNIDFLFIDADHSYRSVKKDLDAWGGYVTGDIACHDYDKGFPGLMRAVDEYSKDKIVREGIAIIKI